MRSPPYDGNVRSTQPLTDSGKAPEPEPPANLQSDDPGACLEPTGFIDADHPAVVQFAREVTTGASGDEERAALLFRAVRDRVRYDPYSVTTDPEDYRASTITGRSAAYCVPKAVLLAGAARAVGIPSRVGFADVRNHLQSERLREEMGTDLFICHGFTELYLGERWLKATPTFNVELCDRFGVEPLDFDGTADALFHEFDATGRRHMDYVSYRGAFTDLPLAWLVAMLLHHYGTRLFSDGTGLGSRPDTMFDPEPPSTR